MIGFGHFHSPNLSWKGICNRIKSKHLRHTLGCRYLNFKQIWLQNLLDREDIFMENGFLPYIVKILFSFKFVKNNTYRFLEAKKQSQGSKTDKYNNCYFFCETKPVWSKLKIQTNGFGGRTSRSTDVGVNDSTMCCQGQRIKLSPLGPRS